MAPADSFESMPKLESEFATETRIMVSLDPRRREIVQGILGQWFSKTTAEVEGISGSRWQRTFVRNAPKQSSRFVSASLRMTSSLELSSNVI